MPRPLAALFLLSVPLIGLIGRYVRPLAPKGPPPSQSPVTPGRSRESIIPPGTIDGSKTPWLIPDSVAYRLFFVTVAEPAERTNVQIRRQRSRLAQAKLTDADYEAVVTILSKFKEAHTALQLKYSEIASHSGFIDENTLASDRDAIVETTRRELKDRLSAGGMAILDAYIQ